MSACTDASSPRGRLRYASSEIFPRGEVPEKCRTQGQRDCVEGKDLGGKGERCGSERERERKGGGERERETLVPRAGSTSEERAIARNIRDLQFTARNQSWLSVLLRDLRLSHYASLLLRQASGIAFARAECRELLFARARGRPCLFASRTVRRSRGCHRDLRVGVTCFPALKNLSLFCTYIETRGSADNAAACRCRKVREILGAVCNSFV